MGAWVKEDNNNVFQVVLFDQKTIRVEFGKENPKSISLITIVIGVNNNN